VLNQTGASVFCTSRGSDALHRVKDCDLMLLDPAHRRDGWRRWPGVGVRVDLIVSDNGCGLPEDDRMRAPARFWRGRDDATGTGLGLAIAAEIAAGHGGTISVEKASEGGLLVRYRLPLAGPPT
jgi:signal transduction histidine kinase